jgi:hypothetical protein
METTTENQPEIKTEPPSQAAMCSTKKTHTPKRKKQHPKSQLEQEKQTQLKN